MRTTPFVSAAYTGKEQIASIKARNTRIAGFEAPLRLKQRERMDKE